MLGDIMKKSFFIVGIFLVLVIFYGFYAFKEEEQNSITHNVIIVKIDGAIKVPGTYEAVSYTHLDVYKRQMLKVLTKWVFTIF